MSETPPSSSQGRWIRAALVIFPVGTVILGIASFGFWWVKKVKVEERSYKYALALRRDLSENGVKRHVEILQEVMSQAIAQRLPAVAAYLESSMGAENMGYQIRRTRTQFREVELSNVDVDLTGKQRPREIILFLVVYGDAERQQAEAHALASLLALAHALTGESGTYTLRFAAVPSAHDPEALERLSVAMRAREERVLQVFVPGGVSESSLAAIRTGLRTEASGTVVTPLPATTDVASTLSAAQVMKPKLIEAAK